MISRIHHKDGRSVMTLCDENILGKTFEEGEKILDLSSPFYDGKKISHDYARQFTKTVSSINAAGEESVDFLIKEGLTKEEDVLKIDNIPHIQVTRLEL
ncbi:MAG: DUF424 domain-containing protein [Nanobdellota archaeon]